MSRRAKIGLIGAGNIGGTMAQIIIRQQLGDVVLVDVAPGIPQGKALDLAQSTAVGGFNVDVTGSNDYALIQGADVLIITAGLPRRPGMSRDDLLSVNADIMHQIAQQVARHAPQAFVIVVTNPLDAMVYAFHKASGLPAHKVVGMAGILDTSRFCYFLAQELSVAIQDVQALVLGGHGDTMVPLLRYASVGGIPLMDFVTMGVLPQERLDEIVQRTRDGGAEIVGHLKTGSAFYAPAAAAVSMARAYLKDERRIMPCAAMAMGEYDVNGLFVGVPVIIGKNGIEKILELPLDEKEKAAFDASVDHVKKLVEALNNLTTTD